MLQPELSSSSAHDAYRAILRGRGKKAAEPTRTIKMLDVDAGEANRMASGSQLLGLKQRAAGFIVPKAVGGRSAGGQPAERLVRIEKSELLDLLFPLFEQAPYWNVRTLGEHTRQPQTYLKEVLADIAVNVRAGPYAGMWTLKPEFKAGREAKREEGAVKGEEGGVKVEAGEGEDRKPVIPDEGESDEDEMLFDEVA